MSGSSDEGVWRSRKVTFNASGWSGSYIVNSDKEVRHDFYTENKHATEKAFDKKSVYEVQCFPLYSILLAIGRTDIDYFGLDAEGSEYKILSTVPWKKVDFKKL
ncbi:hypothetical protein OUZ56_012043 [Daphnia magna]|uniref:Methyltransferase FkbM domain-containing protein n=1 Tax=Daphnia magna TaxID=35525 RepID=A0ABQ9Z241_9CRUS|nr:hypothetical protein OUZ56_012043 [Daphnia magna]